MYKEVPWYKFWNPQSGLLGGFIFGAITIGIPTLIVVILYLVMK